MGWRFRKSFKIFPGVRVNLGKKGITSATIGKGGWTSTNISTEGVKQNLSIPGTGIGYRTDGLPVASNTTRNSLLLVGGIVFGVLALCVGASLIGALISIPSANNSKPATFSSTPTTQTPSPAPSTAKTPKGSKEKKNQSLSSSPSLVPLATNPTTGTRKPTSGIYQLGPRGGCYYINSHGNKTYVEHSFCS